MKMVFRRLSKIKILCLMPALLFYYMPAYAQYSSQIKQDDVSQFLYGIAAVYESSFEGQTTASGEKYSPNTLSAAHRSLPFNTRIEIENLSNGKKVEVLINDRGPFVQNRILNVSKQAAEILGFLTEKTSFVKVTVLELGTSLPTPIGLPAPSIGKDIPQGFVPADANSNLDTRDESVDNTVAPDTVEGTDSNEDLGSDNTNEDIQAADVNEESEVVAFEDSTGFDNIDEGFTIDSSDAGFIVEDNANLIGNVEDMDDSLSAYDTTAVADDLFEDADDLFADFDNEFEYMDDSFNADPSLDQELVKGSPQARVQNITNSSQDFINNTPVEPIGFNTNNQDFLIDDPLSNITIGPDDEYFAAPMPSNDILDTAPHSITPEERQILSHESSNTNPFSDLFDDKTESYSLPQELRNSGTSPAKTMDPAYNIDGLGGNSHQPTEPIIDEVPRDIPSDDLRTYDSFNTENDNTLPNYDNVINNIPNNTPNNTLIETPVAPIEIPVAPIDVVSYNEGFDKQPSYSDVSVTNTAPYLPPSTASTPAVEKPFIPQKMGDHYVIQLGAFSKQKNALDLYEKLRNSGFNAYISDIKIKGKNLIRVRVGYFSNMDQAIQISEQLQSIYNLENRIIQVEYSLPNN